MRRRGREVVAKRGCTCCGTGCVVMLPLAGLFTVGAVDTVGLAALVVWPVVFAVAHVVRLVTGNRQHWEP